MDLGEVGGFVEQDSVERCEGGHGLDYGHGARHYTHIVAPRSIDGDFLSAIGDCFELARKGGYGLERNAECNGTAGGDAALNTAGVVGESCDLIVSIEGEGVVHFAAEAASPFEAHSDFEAFGGIDAHHGRGEHGVEFVVDRLA